MKRMFDDILKLPVFLVHSSNMQNGNVMYEFHVDAFTEPLWSDATMATKAPDARMYTKTYPAVDFAIVISGSVLRNLERYQPDMVTSVDEHGFFSHEVYNQRAQRWEKEAAIIKHQLAGMVLDEWKKQVGYQPRQ